MNDSTQSQQRTLRDWRYPIAALLCPREIEGRTRVQKYMFLLQERAGFTRWNFRPHDYGPYSRKSNADFEELVDTGFVNEERRIVENEQMMYYYSATGDARELVAAGDDESIEETICRVSAEIRNEFDDKTLVELIESIVSEHPDYARELIL